MNNKLIRLTESDLHRIVKKSVNRVLKEGVPMPPTARDRSFEADMRDKQSGYADKEINRKYGSVGYKSDQMIQYLDEIIRFIKEDLIGLYSVSRNKRIENYMFGKLDSLYELREDFQTDSPIMQAYLNHSFNPYTRTRKDSDQYKATSAYYDKLRKGGDTYIGPEAPYGG